MKPAEVLRVLHAVRGLSQDKRIILVGGQAVAWWVGYFEAIRGAPPPDSHPMASKDIDFEGSSATAAEVAALLGGRLHVPDWNHHTPNTGLVEYIDPDGDQREIDFLSTPLGLDEADLRSTAIRFEIPYEDSGEMVPLWVVHPERLLESRVANVMTLKTRHQLALDQLHASIACARLFSGLLLDDNRSRDVLRLNERVFDKCLYDRGFRGLYTELGIDAFESMLVDDRLGDFVSVRYPQMQQLLAERRHSDASRQRR